MENRSKGDLSQQPYKYSGIVTELVQQASTVMMTVEKIRGRLEQQGVDLKESGLEQYINWNEQSARRLVRLAEHIEDLQMLSSQPTAVHCEGINLEEEVQALTELCSKASKEKNVQLHFESNVSEQNSSPYVGAERNLVDKIVLNLVSNAVRAATEVKVRLENGQNEICLCVQDNGPGLPPQVQEHLFESAVTDYLPGGLGKSAGLGLRIVKKSCDLLGWEISIQSDENGTLAIVKIPKSREEFSTFHSDVWDIGREVEREQRSELEMSVLQD